MYDSAAIAPEINTSFGWLNADKPYSIKDLRGKIVLLDFWTYGCINCQHIMPDLKKLEDQYPQQLVIIGIHSAKFDAEKSNDRIKNAILKFGIEHPVVNDADYVVWKAYKVSSWPTVALISPDGKIVTQLEGEGIYDSLNTKIGQLIKEYEGAINDSPIVFRQKKESGLASILKFPSKMTADTAGNVWLADSGNDRILEVTPDGKIITVIGGGKKGTSDGDFATASFNEPQGIALKGNLLYIADTKNNLIRLADVVTKKVTTIAGDGRMGYYYGNNKLNEPVLPNSPWALAIDNKDLYIADAGNHQILRMDLSNNKVFRFAGNGREELTDGPLMNASFTQPSGLSKSGNIIYVADPEGSAIRQIDLVTKQVKTIAGKGLFDFGDKDGPVSSALLQHCTGLAIKQGKLYIADTYNGKIKVLDLSTKIITTLVTGLSEPNDVLYMGDTLWISDTNNNQLVTFNISSKVRKVVDVHL